MGDLLDQLKMEVKQHSTVDGKSTEHQEETKGEDGGPLTQVEEDKEQ
jgi:GTPase